MNKDTRFSIRKLTVGVASIAVASFLTSGSIDAADLSILHSQDEKAAGYNPELPFEPFSPSITYTQPEAPWMEESLDTELPGDDVEDVTEPGEANYENPEAPFAPVEEVSEPREANYENPEAPFAPVEEDEEVTEPRKPNYEDPEAPFAPVEEDEEVTEPRKPNYVDPEAPFAPVEEDEEVTEPRKPNYEDPEAPFAPVEEDEEVTEPRKPNYEDPEAPFAPVEDDEEDLEFEILPGYKVEESIGSDGKPYKRLVPIEEEVEETPDVEEDTPDEEELEVLPGYKVEESIGSDGKPYKRLVPIEEVEEDSSILEVKVVQETEIIPYETERRENADLYVGDEEIITPGQEGKVVKEFEDTYAGDKKVSRKELRVVESVDPVTKIVEYGTKPVKDTKVETHRVEEALPAVEEEDPELLEGEIRTEPGKPKITEITVEITYERGKEVSRKTIKKEVIDEGTAAIKYIGTKRVETITETEDIPFETEERENPELPEGERKVIQEGKPGKKNVHTGEVITEPVNEIIEIGTKVITEEVPYDIEERENPDLPKGERKVIQEGKSGKKNVHTGEVIEQPIPEIIEIGTKVITEDIEFATEERENPDLPQGERNVIQEGKPGKKNVHTGEIIEQPTPEIVEIGTKVVTEDIEFETEERDNPELPEGERKVIQEGKPGKKNVHTGEIIEQPTPEIVEIGTKVITEDIEFATEERENPDLPQGERKVIQEGKPGKKNVHTGEVIEQPIPEIIEIGTKVITEDIEFATEERDNPELPEGERKVIQEGKPGKKNVHTGEVIEQPTPEIVEIGTKVVTEDIEFATEERENPDLPQGERKVIQEGKPGKKNVHTGEVIEQPIPEIIEIGTKVITEDIEFATEERENPDLPQGERKVIQEGKPGKKNVHTGEIIEQPTPEIVEIGTKVVTEDIEFATEERENPELPQGERKVIQEGKPGKKNVHTGEIIEQPTPEIVEIGTKVVTEDIEFETEERDNPELPEGERKVIQEGKPGKKNVHTGEIIEQPTPEIVEIGTKVVTEDIEFATEERENPDLPQGERKVIQEGKPGKKNVHTDEVITEPVNEIIEIGTKVITEEIPYETEERKNPDLPQGERKVIQEGKPGKRNVHTGEVIEAPTLEIIEVGTKKDKLVKWTVDYGTPEPSKEALTNATETRSLIKAEINQISALFEQGLQFMIWRAKSQSSKDFYQKYLDASEDDDGQTVVADFLDYYRKSKEDTSLTLEDLVKDSKGKTGSIYETMILAAAEKIGATHIEPGQSMEDYKQLMGGYMIAPKDGQNVYKNVMDNGDYGAYAPRQDAIDSVNEDFDNIKSLLDHWQDSFKTMTNDDTITREETLARILEYYRQVSGESQATLREAIEDLANYSFSKEGMKAMVNHYDSTLEPLSDIEAYQKVMAITKQGELMESDLNFFTDTVLEILNNLGIPAN